MSLSDERTLMATAHYNACIVAGGKTVSLHLGTNGTPVTGGSALYCMFRRPSKKEVEKIGHRGIKADAVVEIAKQGTVDLTVVKPKKYRFKYGDVYWEIIDIITDDWETTSSGAVDAAVYAFAVDRLDSGGIGELAGL